MKFAFAVCFLIVVAIAGDPSTFCWAPLPKPYDFPESGYEISHVSALVRHGDRSPVHLMLYGEDAYTWNCKNFETSTENDLDNALKYEYPYKIADGALAPGLWHGNCGVGQLTERGFEQHNTLGKALRSIYVNYFKLFPDVLTDPSQVYVRATDYPRTRQSAMSQLAGIWDANHRASATRTLSIEVRPGTVDSLQLSETGGCPRLTKLIEEKKSSPEWKKQMEKVKKTLTKMNSIAGRDWDGLYKHSDVLHPLFCHNMSLPCRDGVCVTMEDLQVVHDGADFEMTFQFTTDEIARLSVGIFLHELRNRMVNSTTSKAPVYALYAAHDFTIAQLFQAFHLGISIWPPYASHVLFELWKKPNSQDMAVRVLYNGEIMKIPGCTLGGGSVCSLEEFDKILDTRLKVDSFQDCL